MAFVYLSKPQKHIDIITNVCGIVSQQWAKYQPNRFFATRSEEIVRGLRLVHQLGLTAPLHFSTAGKSSYLLNIRVNLGPIESAWYLSAHGIRTKFVFSGDLLRIVTLTSPLFVGSRFWYLIEQLIYGLGYFMCWVTFVDGKYIVWV